MITTYTDKENDEVYIQIWVDCDHAVRVEFPLGIESMINRLKGKSLEKFIINKVKALICLAGDTFSGVDPTTPYLHTSEASSDGDENTT